MYIYWYKRLNDNIFLQCCSVICINIVVIALFVLSLQTHIEFTNTIGIGVASMNGCYMSPVCLRNRNRWTVVPLARWLFVQQWMLPLSNIHTLQFTRIWLSANYHPSTDKFQWAPVFIRTWKCFQNKFWIFPWIAFFTQFYRLCSRFSHSQLIFDLNNSRSSFERWQWQREWRKKETAHILFDFVFIVLGAQ